MQNDGPLHRNHHKKQLPQKALPMTESLFLPVKVLLFSDRHIALGLASQACPAALYNRSERLLFPYNLLYFQQTLQKEICLFLYRLKYLGNIHQKLYKKVQNQTHNVLCLLQMFQSNDNRHKYLLHNNFDVRLQSCQQTDNRQHDMRSYRSAFRLD